MNWTRVAAILTAAVLLPAAAAESKDKVSKGPIDVAEAQAALSTGQARLATDLAALDAALRSPGDAGGVGRLAKQVQRDAREIEKLAEQVAKAASQDEGSSSAAKASPSENSAKHRAAKQTKSKGEAERSNTSEQAQSAAAAVQGDAPRGVTLPPPAGTNPDQSAVLLAAGDIADCGSSGDEATAALLDTLDGTIITLGDNVYPSGTADQFAQCYEPSWGRHKARTRPAPGNHDYATPGAAGYYGYFGESAGDPSAGYYSYGLGAWHVVALNSNCREVGGCEAGSPQEQWLRADLAAHPAACTLAYWHHPRFSSGRHGSTAQMAAIWQTLYDAGADVVLSGHDHLYERFAPQDPSGAADPARGIRQFTVGTGGESFYNFRRVLPTSEVRHTGTPGVLKLTLYPASYDWEFVPVAGATFTDAGSDACR